MTDYQAQFETMQAEYIKIQEQKSKLIDLKYENELVQKDFESMASETNLYYIVGPVMVPKSYDEVKKNVADKLYFINRQLEQLDEKMKGLEKQIIEINKRRIAQAQEKAKAAELAAYAAQK